MLKQLLSGIALASVVFLATPPTHAAGPHEPRSYQQRSVQRHRRQDITRQVRPQRPPRHQRHRVHRRHHRRHRQHRGFVGVHIGNHYARPYYSHGHHLHVHDAYCPVIIRPHVHHHISGPPVWEVTYYRHDHPTAQAQLHIIVTPYQGEVYVDGHYIGAAEEFDNGEKRVPLAPGRHTVRLRHHDRDYTQQIQVMSGNTAIVKAKYARGQ